MLYFSVVRELTA